MTSTSLPSAHHAATPPRPRLAVLDGGDVLRARSMPRRHLGAGPRSAARARRAAIVASETLAPPLEVARDRRPRRRWRTRRRRSGRRAPSTLAGSTSWPSDSSSFAASCHRRDAVGVRLLAIGAAACGSRCAVGPGSAPTSSAYGRAGGGAVYGSPAPGRAPRRARAALSRTRAGEHVLVGERAPVLAEVGTERGAGPGRLEPDEPARARSGTGSSRPCRCRARPATMPAATAAAAPPLDPPGERRRVPRVARRRRTPAARSSR